MERTILYGCGSFFSVRSLQISYHKQVRSTNYIIQSVKSSTVIEFVNGVHKTSSHIQKQLLRTVSKTLLAVNRKSLCGVKSHRAETSLLHTHSSFSGRRTNSAMRYLLRLLRRYQEVSAGARIVVHRHAPGAVGN